MLHRTCLPVAVACALLVEACAPAPDPGPPADTEVATVERFEPVQRQGTTTASSVRLGTVVATHAPGGPWRVEVPLAAVPTRAPWFDGLTETGRGEILRPEQTALHAGPTIHPLVDVVLPANAPAGEAASGSLLVPYEPPRHLACTLVFELPDGPLPDDLTLWVAGEDGAAVLQLRGVPRTGMGAPGVAVQPVDAAGLPLRGAASLTIDDVRFDRPPRFAPVVGLPGTGTLDVPGRGQVPVTVGDTPFVDVLVPGPTDAEVRDAAFAQAAATWPVSDDGPADLADLALRTGSPDAVAAWVRDHVAVLAYNGIRQSSTSVLRSRAGGPQERAMLVRDVLAVLGHDARFMCGELSEATARALYTVAVPVTPPPAALADTVARLRSQADALAPALRSVLGARDHAPGARTRFDLIPEWCWVAVEQEEGAPWHDLELRPAPYDAEPLPFVWRATERPTSDTWRLRLRLTATLDHVVDGQDDVLVAEVAVSATELPDTAVIVDQFPGPGPGQVQTVVRTDRQAGLGGKAFGVLDLADVRTLALQLAWTDPDGIASAEHRVALWDAMGGQPAPTLQRVVVTVQPPIPTLDDVGRAARRAVGGGHPAPGLVADRAAHALWGWLDHALQDGAAAAEPSVWITRSTPADGDTIARSTTRVPASLPLWFGDAPDDAVRARSAAIDAVVRATVMGTDAPEPPEVWIDDPQQLGRYRAITTGVQVAVARSMEQTPYAVSPDGDLWRYDPAAGALSWFDARAHGRPAVDAPPPVDPATDIAFWDLTDRCESMDLLARVGGSSRPEACMAWVVARDEGGTDPSP
ncbi:MAG: hypothetical protein H6733_09330 [Alphaproteobacteria bacterium]|nr:hypothetical protein [Alphaproteobacteria bacterium]